MVPVGTLITDRPRMDPYVRVYAYTRMKDEWRGSRREDTA